ncbi:Translation elongation factor P Lys34 hydroxylase [hydrothermal vent metagenome]|uniref:Translation elongation factor P Lys34 hydroxylase n=1 Tax=hydrothermal vent metagenome TaxID=652676 RepID=A0A3B0VFE7_9ZZZZ
MIKLSKFVQLLNENYLSQYNTKITGGFDEPFYQASKGINQAEIRFAHDYIRSALHELAHWCVAGVKRRKIDDFGYWYAADGRSQKQQDRFFKLEIVPQAIEWSFSLICGVRFEASVDNLNNQITGIDEFKFNLNKQLELYLKQGFPKRTKEIIQLLAKYQGIKAPHTFLDENHQQPSLSYSQIYKNTSEGSKA